MSKIVYFLDIDDCLISTSRLRLPHLKEVEKSLKNLKVTKAEEITKEFAASFSRLYSLHQGKKLSLSDQKLFDRWLDKVKDVEKPILEKYGQIKRWSREVGIYLAAQKYGIKLSNNDLIYITNNLWSKISQTASFYPDALPFLRSLQRNKIHFYLITSSDCRLILDDKTGLFRYKPDYSKKLKLARLAKFIKLGIPKENIFIADPYDKPNPWVFLEALNQAKKDVGVGFTSIMIGDSLKNDLLPAKRAGMEKVIWLKRGTQLDTETIPGKITAVSSFRTLYI